MPDARRPPTGETGTGAEADLAGGFADPLLPGGEREADDRPPEADGRAQRPPPPNFLVRRAIFVGVVVAVIAVAAVVVSRFLEEEPAGGSDERIGAEWNTVVVVTDSEVRLVDPTASSDDDELDPLGDVVHEGDGLLDVESAAVGATLVMLDEESGQIEQLDLVEGTVRRARAEPESMLVTDTGHRDVIATGLPRGGDITIIDTRTGDTLDVGDLADLDDPLMFADELIVNASGTHAAVADGRSFQTVLVDLEEGTADLLPGRVADLDDTTIVTAQPAGEQSELDFFEIGGSRLGTVDAPTPEALVLTGQQSALTVTADGRVLAIEADGDLDERGVLTDSERPTVEVLHGEPVLGRTRMLVVGNGFVTVLDPDGEIRATVTGQLVADANSTSRCIITSDAATPGVSTQTDLDSGETLGGPERGTIAATSVDGCTAAIIGAAAPQVLVRGETITLPAGTGSISDLAPDGAVAVASSPGGETLVPVDGGDPPLTVTDEPAVIRFALVP